MKFIKIITLITILYFSITSCKEVECNVADFEGTVSGSWDGKTTCPLDLSETFVLEPSNTDAWDVVVKIADSLIHQIDMGGATKETGCTFQFFDAEGKDYLGDGTLLDDVLTLSYRNNSGDFICTYSGTVQN